MRIAILADFPLSALTGGAVGRGGGQGCTWLPQLAMAFKEYPQLDIHWVIIDRKNRTTKVIHDLGQTFHVLAGIKFSLELLMNYWPTRLAIKSVLKKIKPDIVHAWGTELIYPCALQDFHGPTILSMQGVLTEYQRIGGLPENWIWHKMVKSEPHFLRSAKVITTESVWGKEKVLEIIPTADVRLVEYGVHPDFYNIEWKPNPLEPRLLYIGGSGHRKGFDILMQAVKLIANRTWELRLAGDMEMSRDLAHCPNVNCLGLLDWPQLQSEMQSAWAMVLPTRGDTSPNSVKEARVIGLPVITSKHGGQSGYIADGENGRIVDPLDGETLANAIQEVMSSYDSVLKFGKSRHETDRNYLQSKKTALGFFDIYQSIAK